MPKYKKSSLDGSNRKKKKLYCALPRLSPYPKGCTDEDFSSEKIYTPRRRENRRNEKYIFLIKTKNKKIKNCLVNISSSYPHRGSPRSESFLFACDDDVYDAREKGIFLPRDRVFGVGQKIWRGSSDDVFIRRLKDSWGLKHFVGVYKGLQNDAA